jgi:microcin C transport system permease protein
VRYDGEWYFPAFKRYPETTFGGEFPLEANYKSPYIRELLAKKDAWCCGRRSRSATRASTTT